MLIRKQHALVRLALAVGLLLPGLAVADDSSRAVLARYEATGGLTPFGLGHREHRVLQDGTLEVYNQQQDESLARSSGSKGWSHVKLTKEDLEALRKAILATNFDKLETDQNKVRPSAADGSDVTVEFATPSGLRTVKVWQLVHPESLPAVEFLAKLPQKYAQSLKPTSAVTSPTP